MTSKKGCQDHHLVADNEDHLCIEKVQHIERHADFRVEYTAIRRNS